MQVCNKFVTQLTPNIIRQFAKPLSTQIIDDSHRHEQKLATPAKTVSSTGNLSLTKNHILCGKNSSTIGFNSTCDCVK